MLHWLMNWLNSRAQRVIVIWATCGWPLVVLPGLNTGAASIQYFNSDMKSGMESILSQFADNTSI